MAVITERTAEAIATAHADIRRTADHMKTLEWERQKADAKIAEIKARLARLCQVAMEEMERTEGKEK